MFKRTGRAKELTTDRSRPRGAVRVRGIALGCGLSCGLAIVGCNQTPEPKPASDVDAQASADSKKKAVKVEQMQLAGPVAKGQKPGAPAAAIQGRPSHALAPGATAPSLRLPDTEGKLVELQALLEKGPVVVVFYRGDWCPKCKAQLSELAKAQASFEAKNASLVAVSVDDAAKSKAFARATGASFPLLTDAKLEAIRAWHVEHVGNDIAKPASFVVGRDGKIKFAHVGENPGDRPSVEELVAAL